VRLTRTLFVSDLHLEETRGDATARFERFLEEARDADALYILGDLFEYWVGDDGLVMRFPARIASALADAAARMPIHFMHGNRDFLVAQRFSQQTGVKLIDDPTQVDLYGERVLLMHGDTLCTGDSAYQAFRSQVRAPAWRDATLSRPLAERVQLAERLRLQSEDAKGGKSAEIMDVSAEAVESAFAACGCRVMIHGHTHRPGRHVHEVQGRACVRWVLPDWYEKGGYLEATPEGIRPVALA
jgi:UDP-2,3-diacylglucosamine hydrolase